MEPKIGIKLEENVGIKIEKPSTGSSGKSSFVFDAMLLLSLVLILGTLFFLAAEYLGFSIPLPESLKLL